MRKNPITLTLDELNEIVDEHIVNDNEGFLFLVKGNLCEYLDNYIYDEHNLEIDEASCEDNLVYDNDTDYYVGYFPSDENDSCQLFIEEAKGNSGKYKYSELANTYYYIFTDIPLKIARDIFGNEKIQYCELEEFEDEDCEDCCDCDACREAAELTDGQEEELRLIEQSLEEVLKTEGCQNCIFETLLDLALSLIHI